MVSLANHVRILIRFNRARVELIARYLLARGELAGNQVEAQAVLFKNVQLIPD